MATVPTTGLGVELRSSLKAAIDVVRRVTDVDGPWETPFEESQAGAELLAEEARQAETTGSWPWLTSMMVARWALAVAIEEAKAMRRVIDIRTTSYGADVLCRSVLESSSLVWWLLDPDIGAEQRLARALLYRYSTAKQTQKASRHLGIGEDADRSAYGEMPDTVAEEARALGFGIDRKHLTCGETALPNHTERVAALVEMVWPQHKLPYSMLSAVASLFRCKF
jgi:hypothetical protein